MRTLFITILGLVLAAFSVQAEELVVEIRLVDSRGGGKAIGTIIVSSNPYGILLTPNLSGLTPGLRGFHLHENADCGPGLKGHETLPGLAAGGHHDPAGTGRHAGPYGDGHLGDLPALSVDREGRATHPVLAPRLEVSDLKGHSLVIHSGGGNYTDYPERLGGGGVRVACGIIP